MKFGDFDEIQGDFAKILIYRVVPQLVHHTIFQSPNAPPYGDKELEKKKAEDLLEDAGMMGHRGEMEESYAEQLLHKKSNPLHIIEEINKNAGDGDDMSVSQHLNKAASKVEKNQEQILDDNRKKNVIDNTDRTIRNMV